MKTENVIKKKGYKLFVKWKGYDNSFNRWIDKSDIMKMSQYFPVWKDVELDLSNYATKPDVKKVTSI